MSLTLIRICLLSLLVLCTNGRLFADDYIQQRQQMVTAIKAYQDNNATYLGKKTFDERILQVMATTPRHQFVPHQLRASAYDDQPLPIGYGQTISQPYIVALMTQLLAPQEDDTVLEIGTGSGYQAAVLAQLVSRVYTIEIIEALARDSAQLLSRLGYDNIETRLADGYEGWPQQSPFDGIIVTAAISHIPPPLVAQLKNGGRMVIPVGTRFQTQYLTLVEKDQHGSVSTRQLLPVYFVPFTGGH